MAAKGKRKATPRERPAEAPEEALSPKQEAFCAEYLVDLNGAQAAIRAGYAENSARQQAYDLLTRPYIQKELSRLKKERARRVGVKADHVLAEVADIAYAPIGPDSPVTVAEKLKGLELAGKHIGMWVERVQHEGQLTLAQMVGASLPPAPEQSKAELQPNYRPMRPPGTGPSLEELFMEKPAEEAEAPEEGE